MREMIATTALTTVAAGSLLLATVVALADPAGPLSWDSTATVETSGGGWGRMAELDNGRLIMTSCQNEVSYSNDFGKTWLKNEPPAWPIGFSFSWPAIYRTDNDEIGVMNITSGGAVQIKFGTLDKPTSGSDNFVDDFSGGDDAGWSHYGDKFSVTGGYYAVNNAPGSGNASSKSLAGNETWTSGTLAARVFLASSNNAGVMFRTTNAGFGADEAYGYYVDLDTAGSVTLGKQADGWTSMDGSWTELASSPLTIGTGTWYHAKIVAVGSDIRMYITDMYTPRIHVTDDTWSGGAVGIRAHYTDASFDNVSVTR